MQVNRYRTYKNRCPYSPKYLIPLFIITLCSILLYSIDNGPPLPPFEKGFQSIDCDSLKFSKIEDHGGKLVFYFYAQPSVEYPPEYLVYFLSAEFQSNNLSFFYSGDNVYDPFRQGETLKFSIYHSFSGPTNISFKCLGRNLSTMQTVLKKVEHIEKHFSSSEYTQHNHAKFYDACLEHEKFLYFTQIMGNLTSIPFNNGFLRFEFLKWPITGYLDHKKVNMTQTTCFLVAPPPVEPWKRLLFHYLPISQSLQENGMVIFNSTQFIFLKEPDPKSSSFLSLFSSNPPIQLHSIQCFDKLLLTKSYSNPTINQNTTEMAFSQDFSYMRKWIPKSKLNPKLIAVDEAIFEELEDKFKGNLTIVPIKMDADIQTIGKLVSSAQVLIANHPNLLMNMILMTNGSTVLDISPPGEFCHNYPNVVSSKIGVKYLYLNGESNCRCSEFSCLKENYQYSSQDLTRASLFLREYLNNLSLIVDA